MWPVCLRLGVLQVTLAGNRYNGWEAVGLTPFENPIVLLTRPTQSSELFRDALKDAAGAFRPYLCPAFEYEAVAYPEVSFDAAIFTSKAGVQFAPNGNGRVAWCVGEATAQMAQAKGYPTRTGAGSAMDLSTMILRSDSCDRMNHFRGENVRIDVRAILEGAGLTCRDTIVYRKVVAGVPEGLRDVLSPVDAFILPVFSGETVSITGGWGLDLNRAWVVAISEVVALDAQRLNPKGISTAANPNLDEMVRIMTRLIA